MELSKHLPMGRCLGRSAEVLVILPGFVKPFRLCHFTESKVSSIWSYVKKIAGGLDTRNIGEARRSSFPYICSLF